MISKMKAMVLKSNGVLAVEDVAAPQVGDDEYLVHIEAAGVCSSDVARGFNGGAYHYPLIMGHEAAGTIAAAGKKTTVAYSIGTRVGIYPLIPCGQCEPCQSQSYVGCKNYDYYGSRRDGAFAEFVSVRSWNLIPLPDAVSWEQAALLEPFAVVIHGLRRGGLLERSAKSDQPIAILGAGLMGMIAVALVRHFYPNTPVTIFDRNKFKLDKIRANGIDAVHVANDADWDGLMKTHAERYGAVVEACGAPETFRRSIYLARYGASIVWMGNVAADLTLKKAEVSSILRKELTVCGTWNSDFRTSGKDDWKTAIELLSAGFKFPSFVTHRPSLVQLPNVLSEMKEQKENKTGHGIIKAVMVASR